MNDAHMVVPSRHLGLVQADELAEIDAMVEHAATSLAEAVDLDALLALARPIATTPAADPCRHSASESPCQRHRLRLHLSSSARRLEQTRRCARAISP